jgi:hypothetical protein
MQTTPVVVVYTRGFDEEAMIDGGGYGYGVLGLPLKNVAGHD